MSRRPAAARRDVLGSFGAMLILSSVEAGSAKAAELDGELIAVCAAAAAADDQSMALLDPVDDLLMSDPRCKAAWDQSHQVMRGYSAGVKRAAELPARTPEGLRAKAELALRSLMPNDDEHLLVVSLLRDMLGRAGA